VPSCPTACSYYSDYPSGTCGDGTTCFNVAKEICTCQSGKYVCAAPPPVDPSCPYGCLWDQYVTPAFDGGIDTGARDDTGDATDGGALDAERDAGPADAGDAG